MASIPEVLYRPKGADEPQRVAGRRIIGADGARSNVARQEVPGGDTIPYVIAYHEIIEAPGPARRLSPGPLRCRL